MVFPSVLGSITGFEPEYQTLSHMETHPPVPSLLRNCTAIREDFIAGRA